MNMQEQQDQTTFRAHAVRKITDVALELGLPFAVSASELTIALPIAVDAPQGIQPPAGLKDDDVDDMSTPMENPVDETKSENEA